EKKDRIIGADIVGEKKLARLERGANLGSRHWFQCAGCEFIAGKIKQLPSRLSLVNDGFVQLAMELRQQSRLRRLSCRARLRIEPSLRRHMRRARVVLTIKDRLVAKFEGVVVVASGLLQDAWPDSSAVPADQIEYGSAAALFEA